MDTKETPTHLSPKGSGSQTQCCNENVFYLPWNHKMTNEPKLVTCKEYNGVQK